MTLYVVPKAVLYTVATSAPNSAAVNFFDISTWEARVSVHLNQLSGAQNLKHYIEQMLRICDL